MQALCSTISALPGTKRVDVFVIARCLTRVRIQYIEFGTPNGNGHMRDFQIVILGTIVYGRVFNQAETGMLTIQLKGLTVPMLQGLEAVASHLLTQLGFGSASYRIEFNVFVSKLLHVKIPITSRLLFRKLLASHPEFHGAIVTSPPSGRCPILVVSLQGVKFQVYPSAFLVNFPSSDGSCELFMKMLRNLRDICEIVAQSPALVAEHSSSQWPLVPIPIRLRAVGGGAVAILSPFKRRLIDDSETRLLYHSETRPIDDSETESELDTPKAAVLLGELANA